MLKHYLLLALLFTSLILGLGLSPSIQAAGSEFNGSWTVKTGMPTAREGLAAGAVGSKVYAVKGYIPGDSGVTEAYDTLTDSWTRLATSSISESELGGTAVGTKVYAVGGRTTGGSTVDVYDTISDSWSTAAPMPTPRRGAAAVAVGTRIFAIGGSAGGAPGGFPQYDANEAYDTTTNAWTILAPMPTPRSDAYAVHVSGKIYVVGGYGSLNFTSPFLSTVEVYDIAGNTWSIAAPMPTPRSHAVAGVCGDSFFVIGGAGDGFTALPTVEAYSTRTDSWVTDLPPMPTPRWEIAAAQVGNTLYVLGGGGFGAIVRNPDGTGPNEAFTMDCPAGRPSLSVSPTVNSVPRRAIFSVSVNVANITSLYSLQVVLAFDSDLLTALSIDDSGNVLRTYCSETPGCSSVSSQLRVVAGFVEARQSLVGNIPGFSGSGPVFRILFTVRGTGTSVLHIASNALGEGNGELANPQGVPLQHFSVDGVFSNGRPDLFISLVPNLLTLDVESSDTSNVTLYPLNGLTGTVALALTGVPPGVDASLDQPELFLTGPSVSTTLTVTAGLAASPGNFTVTLSGSVIGKRNQTLLARSASLELTVTPPRADFSISLTPQSIAIPRGSSGSADITVSSIHGFTAPVQLRVMGLPFDVTHAFSINPVTPGPGGTASSTLTLFVSQSAFVDSFDLAVLASGGGVSRSSRLNVVVSRFDMFASPFSLTLQPGQMATASIEVFSFNGFTGTVELETVAVPVDIAATLSPSTVTLNSNASSAFSTLNIQVGPAATPGTFILIVLGTSGNSFSAAVLQLQIIDFSVSLVAGEVTVPVAGSASSAVFLASLNGFTGLVNLRVSGVPAGVNVSVTPSALRLDPGVTTSAELMITTTSAAQAGNFDLTITASNGPTAHSATLRLRIADFSISITPASLSLGRRETADLAIEVAPLNGFSLPVTLTISELPTGVTATFIPSTVTPSGTTASSTLTLAVDNKPALGTFTLTVTATSGSLIHSTTITLTVTR